MCVWWGGMEGVCDTVSLEASAWYMWAIHISVTLGESVPACGECMCVRCVCETLYPDSGQAFCVLNHSDTGAELCRHCRPLGLTFSTSLSHS